MESASPDNLVARPQNALLSQDRSSTTDYSSEVRVIERHYIYKPPTFFDSARALRFHAFLRRGMPDPWKHVLSTKDLYKCLLSERPDSLPSVTPSYLEAGNKPEIEHSQEGSACAEGLRRRHGCSENGRSSQTPNPTGTGAQHNSDDAQARHDRRVKRVEKQMETVLQEAKADRYHVFICWGKQNECDILAVAIEKVKLESQSELWKEIRRAYYASRGSWRKFVPLLRVKNVSKASVWRVAFTTGSNLARRSR